MVLNKYLWKINAGMNETLRSVLFSPFFLSLVPVQSLITSHVDFFKSLQVVSLTYFLDLCWEGWGKGIRSPGTCAPVLWEQYRGQFASTWDTLRNGQMGLKLKCGSSMVSFSQEWLLQCLSHSCSLFFLFSPFFSPPNNLSCTCPFR